MNSLRDFHGPNAAYVLELYDRYIENPYSVDLETKALFDQWKPGIDGEIPSISVNFEKIVGAVNLAQGIREYGHLAAKIDPLGSDPPGDPSLDPSAHGLTKDDLRMLPANLVGGPIASKASNALDAIEDLFRVYTTHIG